MRIIAGTSRGRKLFSPGRSSQVSLIRPTADRAREALFSVIGDQVLAARVLDLYAGTGALGLEALSRGADSALFVDCYQKALDLIGRNIAACGFSDCSVVIRRDLTKGHFFLKKFAGTKGFSLVFIDPPYGKKMALSALRALGAGNFISPGGLVIAEDIPREEFPEVVGGLRLQDIRRYGDTGFWIYRADTGNV
ncbi:MAG: 16S rRNA (guanine(966)-N(2))-methyltransferase RsmD [Proteobacteria bacterium]|nr:16S rRNA (guanine(966)-N(2))-methyltransferase RsmD [Pseudomonadota bacterium]MBU1715191.1 16S rRNA (guanine(966)-N(2))-methyltransferase RsmD [Pseudomonadota bacterium]